MKSSKYYTPAGGLSAQTDVMTDRAMFTEAFAVIPRGVMQDIVTSSFPFWEKARAWVLARPLSGFAETFAHYIMELAPEGGSDQPEPEVGAEAGIFVVSGEISLTIDGVAHALGEGGYAFVAPNAKWQVWNRTGEKAVFHWIRKSFEAVDGLDLPESYVTSDADVAPSMMPDTNGAWSTTRFADPEDLRHDMHVNVVNIEPGGVIPFAETHVMEHGLYVLEGKAVYRLNTEWVEVEAGDYMWLRAFCPQACVAAGPGRFRYLLYKDVNRHPKLKI